MGTSFFFFFLKHKKSKNPKLFLWGLAQNNKLGLEPVQGSQPIWGANVTQVIHIQTSLGTKTMCPRRNFFSDTENSERMHISATETPLLNTWKGRKHEISKQKLSPPHWMHYSYSPGRINVEKTPEQCYIGYHNSQITERGVWWDRFSSKGLDDRQM